MIVVLSQYLDRVRDNLRLDLTTETEVINELQTHMEDRVEEMREAGLSEDEAARTCVRLLGSARQLARQIYEARSQGTWQQAFMASMPHLFFAILFWLNWWQEVGWWIILPGLVLTGAVYGWWRDRSVWIFPWVGYSLVPVVLVGMLLAYVPPVWQWLALLLYFPLAVLFVGSVTLRTIKRDWLFGSLMMLPVPTVIGWFLAVGREEGLLNPSLDVVHRIAPSIGLTFLALAVTVVLFVRLRARWIKGTLLFISGSLTLIMIAFYTEGRLSLPTFCILNMVMFGLLATPALVERRIRRRHRECARRLLQSEDE